MNIVAKEEVLKTHLLDLVDCKFLYNVDFLYSPTKWEYNTKTTTEILRVTTTP